MGWILFLVFAGATGLALWRSRKLDRNALELTGAALLLALAGYAWQGSPMVPGNPVKAADAADTGEVPADLRKTFASSMNAEGQWLSLADALIQAGRPRAAVSLLTEATRKAPENPDVWVGLGNALVVQGGGQMSPAAQFAFERAAAISPNHPGPPFFLGLGLAQAGKLDEAGEVWRALLARAPANAPWKADLEARLAQIDQLPTKAGNATPVPSNSVAQ
ncbi:tetratricopeptide repeat protein [Aquisediminimonas profunda]|uniref:tetratricopeptide repeat protein n=1 Tax=Aquisediminimonas profunda TaxID=1550733 RepID=UPI001C63A8F7|nr:tetratricopeptide repeat protein [Aquisediminimonas profunda]